MKRVLVASVLLLVGTAVAGPKTKKQPDKYAQAASEAFIAAEAADAKGDASTAMGLYNKAFDISPHPSTAYNIGDVERRANHIGRAIEWYEMYLLLAPNATDAKEVNALIAKLTSLPTVIHLKSSPPASSRSLDLGPSYILFDGDIVKRSDEPVAFGSAGEPMLDIDGPSHNFTLDVVSPLTFAKAVCEIKRNLQKQDCLVAGLPRVDGSVVIDSNVTSIGVVEAGEKMPNIVGRRTKLTPGKHRLMVKDRDIECVPLTIDVPANNDIAYVFLRAEKAEYFQRCREIEIIQRRLPFK